MGKLSALSAKALHTPGRHGDGDGLYLNVAPGGSKSWVQRIVVQGCRRDIGLGSYPTVSLARAREIVHSNRIAVSEGRDPLKEKREALKASRSPSPSIPTFAEAAAKVIELHRPTWNNPKHVAQWESTLATYAFPLIGNMLVSEIDSNDVFEVLAPIWTEKHETASRVRQRMEAVFNWAITKTLRKDNPASKAVLSALPQVSELENHHKALHYSEVPAALATVRESTADPITRLAFEFLVLTAARSGEVRLSTWSEIKLGSATWTVPAERMKARRVHKVPLTGRCLEILSQARELSPPEGSLIFPSRSGRPLSDMTLSKLLGRMEIPAVPHGFRSSFKDWCMDTDPDDERWFLSEAALSHPLGNSTQRSYARGDLLKPRRPLMEEWAEFCLTGCGTPTATSDGKAL